jgi:uncharacterized repeat protein (TIGR01451 family)
MSPCAHRIYRFLDAVTQRVATEGGWRWATRKSGARWLRRAAPAIALIVLSGVLAPAAWAPERNFTARFTTNDTGNITIVGNTLMSCDPTDTRNAPTTCAQARAGTAPTAADSNNNEWRMVRVDQDGDSATTLDSTSATLTLPPGATVLFAGLYYGAETTAGTGGQPAPVPAGRNTVKLKVPGASTYETLTANTFDLIDTIPAQPYQGFVDVTGRVAAAGNGDYWVGDVQAATGIDRDAGWALVVAYRDTAQPARNLTVFDGFTSVTSGTGAVAINLSGFRTPPAGPVRTTLGVVAFEGDRGSTGDSLTLNSTLLKDASNPGPPPSTVAANFFNSTIGTNGVPFTAKQPNYLNQLGFDADLVNADGILPNGATDAKVTLKTSSEQYFPGVVTFATELFAPSVQATKTVTDLDGGSAERGDTLRYAVNFINTGQDGADNFVATDLMPLGTTYVPGSLQVLTGPNLGAKTDTVGDDQAEFSENLNSVVFRLGQNATGANGGRLTAVGGPASSSSFGFDVRIDADLAARFPIVNQAGASFLAQSLGTPLTSLSNKVTTLVDAPDLTLTKTHTGGFVAGAPTRFTISVSNVGTIPTDGTTTVTVSDTFPSAAFTSITIVPTPGWDDCSVTGLVLDCARTDVLAAGATYPAILVDAVVADPPPATIDNTAVVDGGGDSDQANNQSTDTGLGTAEADLSVTKTVSASAVPSGGEITFDLVVHNAGPSMATGVTLTDTLGADYAGVTTTATQGTCTSAVVCTLGSLAVNATATVTITATVTANDTTLANTASVTSAARDPVPEDNTASASFVVQKTTDLVLTKAVTQSPNAGQPDGGTYTITARNAGPLDATNVGVADTIPAEFTPSTVTAPGFTCNLPGAGEQLSCSRQTLTVADGPQTITVLGTFSAASAGTTVVNGADVHSDEADLTPEDNADAAETVPIPSADLELQKTASASSVLPGGTVAFTLTVVNNGPSPASAVAITDTLPPELTFVSSPDCSAAGNVVTCDVGALGVGASRALSITAEAAVTAAAQTVTNTASAASETPDPVDSNNSATAQFVVQNATDVRLTKTVTPSPIAGLVDGGTYTMTVSNAGPIPTATNVSVVDQLPSEFTPGSVTAPGFTCNLPGAGGTLTCTRPTLTIADGEATINVRGTFSVASAGTTVVNGAVADADQDDSVSENNAAAAETTPVSPPTPPPPPLPPQPPPPAPPAAAPTPVDVAVDVRPPAGVVREGGIAEFRINVTNRGPGQATSVVLIGTATRAASDSVASLLQSNCTRLPLRCELGTLAPGQQRSVTVRLRRLVPGRLTLTGSVTAAETETTLANNIDRASIRIRAGRATVGITKHAGTASARSGESIGFTITVRNTGAVPARNVTVCDRLPGGLAFERLGGATTRYRITTGALSVARVRRVTNTGIVQGANVARRTATARVTLRPAAQRPPFTG